MDGFCLDPVNQTSILPNKQCWGFPSLGVQVTLLHVIRDANQIADMLSNEAMDGGGWDGFKETSVCPKNFKLSICQNGLQISKHSLICRAVRALNI